MKILAILLFCALVVTTTYAVSANEISAEVSGAMIADAIEDVYVQNPQVEFVLPYGYLGVEIFATSLRSLAARGGTIHVVSPQLTAVITHDELNTWEMATGGSMVIRLGSFPDGRHTFNVLVRSGLYQSDFDFSSAPVLITTGVDLGQELALVEIVDNQVQSRIFGEVMEGEQEVGFLVSSSMEGFSIMTYSHTVDLGEMPPTDAPYTEINASVRLYIDHYQAMINGMVVTIDAAPFIDPANNRTMVPLRVIAEAFGTQVEWDEVAQAVIIFNGGVGRALFINQPLPNDMGTAVIVGGRTFVPLRYVSDMLGAEVEWDAVHRAVNIF